MKPLDTGLNLAIMHIASRLFPTGFDVSEDAPHSFDQLKANLDAGRRMLVFSGGSDTTIYADPEVNWCFRAWHDWCHWQGNHPFSLVGETAVFRLQARHLVSLYGDGLDVQRWINIVHAEIVGQAEFYEANGHFPEDQHAFVLSYLATAEGIASTRTWSSHQYGPQPPAPDTGALIVPSLRDKTTYLRRAKAR